jgi:hypothetical protein
VIDSNGTPSFRRSLSQQEKELPAGVVRSATGVVRSATGDEGGNYGTWLITLALGHSVTDHSFDLVARRFARVTSV